MTLWVDNSTGFPRLYLKLADKTYLLMVQDKNPKRAYARHFELCNAISDALQKCDNE